MSDFYRYIYMYKHSTGAFTNLVRRCWLIFKHSLALMVYWQEGKSQVFINVLGLIRYFNRFVVIKENCINIDVFLERRHLWSRSWRLSPIKFRRRWGNICLWGWSTKSDFIVHGRLGLPYAPQHHIDYFPIIACHILYYSLHKIFTFSNVCWFSYLALSLDSL